MKFPLNPFKLHRELRDLSETCAKQCTALNAANAHISELIFENIESKKQIRFLQTELKIAQDRLTAERMLREMVQRK